MAAMHPAEPDSQSGQLDAVIEKIETVLPTIHRMCRSDSTEKKTPTDRLTQLAKSRLKELSEDPIVNSDASDILEASQTEVNCGHPHRVNGATSDTSSDT